jgi:Holliday junction resolvase RusA-like endonuclease
MSKSGDTIAFFKVSGVPETKGSWRAIGRGRVKADNPREKAWANAVGWAAKLAMRSKRPTEFRVRVDLMFNLPPPKGRKNQRDVDKLIRSCLDSITGIVIVDDELVDEIHAIKHVTSNAEVHGVLIEVSLR